MADFDNGLPPAGTDVTGNSVNSVNITGADADNPELEGVKGIFLTSGESEDTSFSIQVICDEEWIVASCPEWILPDTLSGNGNGTIDIVLYRNTGHRRTGKIVVQTADGMARAEHTVTQEAGGTVYIADINITLAANAALTSGQLLLENVRVNRNGSELIEEIGPFNIRAGQMIQQQISYSSLEEKPDAVTCTVWVANIAPVPANRQVNILSGGVLAGTIITDANGLGSMEMIIPIINTGLDNYTMNIEAVAIDDYVTLDSTSHLSPGAGDTFTIRVTSNAHWSLVDLPAWAHADVTSGGTQGITVTNVHIRVDANSGGARNAFFTAITDNGTASAIFQILQDRI